MYNGYELCGVNWLVLVVVELVIWCVYVLFNRIGVGVGVGDGNGNGMVLDIEECCWF